MGLSTRLVVFAALFLGGCNVAAWGNIAVLALTLVIFIGTLNLGRGVSREATGENPDRGSVER